MMDLATRRPLVFCPQLTPESSVVDSVIASCAIPGVLSATRAIHRGVPTPTVHQLIDGGAWSNFPLFVFTDLDFRAWVKKNGTGRRCRTEAVTIGYILDDVAPLEPARVHGFIENQGSDNRFDLGSAETSSNILLYVLSRLTSSLVGRLALAVALFTAGAVSIAQLPSIAQSYDLWAEHALPLVARPLPFAMLTALLILMVTVLFVLVLGLLLAGHVVLNVVVPAGIAALGPATGVPPWVGSAKSTLIISVPASGLRTMSFMASEKRCRAAIRTASEMVLRCCLDGSRLVRQGETQNQRVLAQTR